MHIEIKILHRLLAVFVVLSFAGCLESAAVAPFNISLDNTSLMLRFAESNGDFANTPDAPGLIDASDLFDHLQEITVIDVRPPADFQKGWIKNAVSTTPPKLFSLVDSLRKNGPSGKIAIVDQNGQSAAYYTCLLRLAGFKDIYCLNFGMASWNSDFAGEWHNACKTSVDIASFSGKFYDKKPLLPLPVIEFPRGGTTTDEKCLARIKEIISAGFNENSEYVRELSIEEKKDTYVICYGLLGLYYGGWYSQSSTGHFPGSVFYSSPIQELRSTSYLQTLPPSGKIVIYSTNGQLSSCMTAHLTLLGYKAKSLLYGAHSLFYSDLKEDDYFSKELFTLYMSGYPYEK